VALQLVLKMSLWVQALEMERTVQANYNKLMQTIKATSGDLVHRVG
jgi:hypothetical protein